MPPPTALINLSPEGRAVASGTADDPTDETLILEAPLTGSLGRLYLHTDGEVGLRIARRQRDKRLVPWEPRAVAEGFLFRESWPGEGLPLGFRVLAEEELSVAYRNRSGAERVVEATLSILPRWAEGDDGG